MIKHMDLRVVEAVTKAVHATIAIKGIEGLRATSMFPSASQRVELPLAA